MTPCLKVEKSNPFQDTMRVCTSFLEGLNTPRALTISLLAAAYLPHNVEAYISAMKELRPLIAADYAGDVDAFRSDYQATVLFSKLPSPVENPALKAAAIEGFFEGEKRLEAFNNLWLNESKVEAILSNQGVDLQELKRIVKSILGRAPTLRTLAKRGSWSSGSSFLLRRGRSDEAAKCEFGVSCTLPLAKAINDVCLPEDLSLINWSSRWVLAPGNLLDTVPKDIAKDRSIAKEPEINMFFQKAIGDTIRRCLLHVGIDLNDQSNNQWCALNAMRLGLATLDLRNASNSICWGLVYCLLPPDWRDLIFLTRSERGTWNTRQDVRAGVAEWHEYQMISSMGNGFTFELESLIFFSICLACGVPDYKCYIYGDDIIIPQADCDKVIPVLETCGFEINIEKSFTQGTFFESCGVYSFEGVDVTPIKIKELLNGPKDYIVLANKIRWFSHICTQFIDCDRRYLPAWQACIRGLPPDIRRLAHGPVGSGLLIWKNRNEVPYRPEKDKQRRPYFQQEVLYELRCEPKTREVFHPGILVAAVSRVKGLNYYDDSFWFRDYGIARGNTVTTGVDSYSLGKIHHDGASWYDLGIWS